MHLINDLPLCEEKLGAWYQDKVLNFESTMMCTNNVVVDDVVMNLHIMDVMALISLTHKFFPSTCLIHSSYLFSCSVVMLVLLRIDCPHIRRQYMFSKSLY